MSYLGAEGDVFSRSIANALEAFRKGVDGELRKKDELIRQLQAKNNKLQDQSDELQQENASLQARLATTKEEKLAHVPFGVPVHDVPIDCNSDEERAPPVPYKTHAQLVRDFNMLSQNIRAFEKNGLDYQKKYRDMKKTAKLWKEHAEKCERESKTGRTSGFRALRPDALLANSPSSRLSTAEPERDVRLPTFDIVHNSPLRTVELSTLVGELEKDRAIASLPAEKLPETIKVPIHATPEASKTTVERRSGIPSSSQTTESERDTQFPSDGGHDIPSSPPVMVSEKVLKRKRGAAATVVLRDPHEGTPAKPIKIKSEPHSSPPKPSSARRLSRVETLDLDEVDDRIDTPRKRRRIRELQKQTSMFRASPLSFLSHQRSRSLPPVKDTPIASTSNSSNSEVENLHPDIEEETVLPPDDRALSEPIAVKIVHPDEAYEVTPSRSKAAKVLQPISTNQKILPRTSDMHEKHKRQDENRGAKALYTVAEDGDHLSTTPKLKSPYRSFNADPLDHLLDEPAPARKQLTSPAMMNRRRTRIPHELPSVGAQTEKSSSKLEVDLSGETPKFKQLPTPNPANSGRPTFESARRGRKGGKNENTPSRGRPDTPLKSRASSSRPPLRRKPVDALNMDDFKLNPKAKGGLDLAYADPVRGREARRHMDGCTDPNCANCGDQLQALAAELDVTVGSTLFASTQDNDLTEEEKLLKFYLGDTFDRKMAERIKPETRTKMILQAKTKILAERVARHRVKPMGRAKSPPGFWDYDMPTTQELEAQREEADKRQNEIVSERYREAMRPGGRWIFRDE